MNRSLPVLMCGLLAVLPVTSSADVKLSVERIAPGEANRAFSFKQVPAPARNDAAQSARFILVDGQRDANGGELGALHDGKLPRDEDQPAANFFFRAGTAGGRIAIDLGRAMEIKQVNTYSWHANTRGPQVYKLYGATGEGDGFSAEPRRPADPLSAGWKLIAFVDTRAASEEPGGQYGVSIADSSGALGKFRHLLFDIDRTEDRDAFGNTFFSEIDVVDTETAPLAIVQEEGRPITKAFEADGGKYRFTIDATVAPELMEWADKELTPVVQEWYPKIVAMLPSDGFDAPTNVTLLFRDNMGGTPASAGGGRINLNAGWFQRNLKGEAKGAVVHEMVHIVQSYGRARRTNPNATRTPGWIVEGIPDYIRWFLYEPQTKGAEITARNLARAKYDASYRVTGNFLHWATEKYDKNLVRKLNAAAREGKYKDDIWKEFTGKTVEELGAEWRKHHEERLAPREATSASAGSP